MCKLLVTLMQCPIRCEIHTKQIRGLSTLVGVTLGSAKIDPLYEAQFCLYNNKGAKLEM